MAYVTKCGKCDSTSFQVRSIEPADSSFKLNAVQCNMCGTPFGVTDYFNLGALLQLQEKAIAALEQKIDHLQHGMTQVVQALNAMRR
jgi:predicted ATPase